MVASSKEIEIDLLEAAMKAEEMMGGLTCPSIKMHEFTASLAVLIGTMASEYEVDSMIMIQDIETIVNALELD